MVKVNFYLRKRGKAESARKSNVAYPVYSILMRVSFSTANGWNCRQDFMPARFSGTKNPSA